MVDYDPIRFEGNPERIPCLLGVLPEVHHIGRTSVPGLCAELKIDLHVPMRSYASTQECMARM
ncbi:GrpB family protein [Ensifer canadensis]